ncbi:hypothetical protein AWM75_03360 [Aerococcus urinaehominis]|uniref:Uncharacterized protein n=1 Tax=Aerococcus urinaehominis TaxID=128944 RepID=A0A0X8FM00_9LACT|nr:formate/nitrite transporter family protein [Aerococcus urinaehominis]AMB99097.1 hypothetical protein AWM75_03360 [Aerococcus urinaehominis]SDM03539.1 formate/nitrite transporter [Aerococcus urinaehominis]
MNELIDKAAQKKVGLLVASPLSYCLRAIFAGIFLTFGTAVAMMIANNLYHLDPAIAKIAYALLFPWGLVMIIMMNAELATSNMMYTSYATGRGSISIGDQVKVLLTCTTMNLLGSVVIAWALSQTAIFNQIDDSHYLFYSVQTKIDKAWGLVFFDAILANILVNIAIVGSLRIKENAAKIIYIIGVIFIFAYFGFEHVIANFGSFSLVAFTQPQVVDNFQVTSILIHWLLAFLGNFVGGGLCIGLAYGWLNKHQEYLD